LIVFSSSDKIRSPSEAHNLLLSHPFVGSFCKYAFHKKLPCAIIGSTPLSVIRTDANITPNDLDIVIKNVDIDKLVIVENIIKEMFPNDNFIVIRSIITVTWVIFESNESSKMIYQIQANIMNSNSWSEYLITCHSNLVTVCYDIMEQKFLCLKERFIYSITDNVHNFTNILSADSKRTLQKAINKYNNRGFQTNLVYVKKNKSGVVCDVILSDCDASTVGANVFMFLAIKYGNIKNISYSTTVRNIYTKEDTKLAPNAIKLWELSENQYPEFYSRPGIINETIILKNRDNDCQHVFGIREFLTIGSTTCPHCTTDMDIIRMFNPILT